MFAALMNKSVILFIPLNLKQENGIATGPIVQWIE